MARSCRQAPSAAATASPICSRSIRALDATGTLALLRGPNLAYDACLVALQRVPPRRLDLVAGHRARKDLFIMLAARELRPALALLDPRFRPPVPIRLDPVPFVREVARLLSKRVPGSTATVPDA